MIGATFAAVLRAVFEPAEGRGVILGVFNCEGCAVTEEERNEVGVAFPTSPVERRCTVESEVVDRDATIQKSFYGGSAVHLGEIDEEAVDFGRWEDGRRCGGMFGGSCHAITEEAVEWG